jgi:hypothetical protein
MEEILFKYITAFTIIINILCVLIIIFGGKIITKINQRKMK